VLLSRTSLRIDGSISKQWCYRRAPWTPSGQFGFTTFPETGLEEVIREVLFV
jgi:hypothetical protein